MTILGLGLLAIGYAVAYYAIDILVNAYTKTTPMNPPPIWILLGIPSSQGNGSGGQGAARSAS
jgi:hypothetical protein